jgi:predicted phosphodiesterase
MPLGAALEHGASGAVKLYAISDLHVRHPDNRRAVEATDPHPDDWLVLAGDIGESTGDLAWTLDTLGPRFRQLVWVPGNHELWSVPDERPLRGRAKYDALVATCRARGVLTPEDPYPLFGSEQDSAIIAPLFLLYDYSFAPEGMTPDAALAWAREAGVECVDEHLLFADPHPTRQAWCAARLAWTEERLTEAAARGYPLVLINHFPLRDEHAVLPAVPRFRIWCGTRKTSDWHRRFKACAVVYGHLHIRSTRHLDGVRFEEVSFGYPRQWRGGIAPYLRQILPG